MRSGPQEEVTLAILAGGKGTRLGGVAKGLISVEGASVLERLCRLGEGWARELLLVGSLEAYAGFEQLRRVPDLLPERGAPGGVHAALAGARTPWVLIVACDMPDVRPAVVARLLAERSTEADAVCFQVGGRPEPLLGLYRSALAEPWGQRLGGGRVPSLRALLSEVRTRSLPEPELRRVDPDLRSVRNLNTPEDLRARGATLPSKRE